jgi:hypothetical protein
LFAVETLEPELLDRLPGFKRRLEWFIENRPDLVGNVACMRTRGNCRSSAAINFAACFNSCSTSRSFCRLRHSSALQAS